MQRQPIGRKLLASALALFVIGAAVIPPLLDAAEDYFGVRVEREHDPATCAVLHNHTACTQLVKSFSQETAFSGAVVRPDVPERTGRILAAVALPLRAYSPSPSPRAPPIHIT